MTERDRSEPGPGAAPREPEPLPDADPSVLRARVRELRDALQRRDAEIAHLTKIVGWQRGALDSLGWRAVTWWRSTRDRLVDGSAVARAAVRTGARAVQLLRGQRPPAAPSGAERYDRWVARTAHGPGELEALAERAGRVAVQPRFSIVVDGSPGDELAATLGSIAAQVWSRWNVVLAGTERAVEAARATAQVGDRVASEPDGDFVLFLSAGDTVAPEALFELALAVEADPEAVLVYSDEDRVLPTGRRVDPWFKPDWSPALLLSMNYVGQLVAFRRTSLLEAAGPAAFLPGRDLYDVVLRVTDGGRRAAHVAKVLYHRSASAPAGVPPVEPASAAGQVAIEQALARRGIDARVERTKWPVYRVRYPVQGKPLVSIVIPTKDQPEMLRRCLESIERSSTWPHRELIVVDNGTTDADALRLLADAERSHRVLRDARAFNWAALNDEAVRHARGAHLLFMNNDMEVVEPGWIEAMLEHSQRAEIGAVGAKLLYPDRSLQHAGVVLGIGVASHAFKGVPDSDPTYAHLAHAIRDVSAVTGACMMVRRDVFERLGGFDERLTVAFNDIDFCLRARAAGYRVLYTPHAVLVHHESVTRGKLHPQAEEDLMVARWRAALGCDPYYNPNLTRDGEDYAVAG